jgi:hypothetical protein
VSQPKTQSQIDLSLSKNKNQSKKSLNETPSQKVLLTKEDPKVGGEKLEETNLQVNQEQHILEDDDPIVVEQQIKSDEPKNEEKTDLT